jgi:hypothetical protein
MSFGPINKLREENRQLIEASARSHMERIIYNVISELKAKSGVKSDSLWKEFCGSIETTNNLADWEYFSNIIYTITHQKLSMTSLESKSTIWQQTKGGKAWQLNNPLKTFLDVFNRGDYCDKETANLLKLKIFSEALESNGIFIH